MPLLMLSASRLTVTAMTTIAKLNMKVAIAATAVLALFAGAVSARQLRTYVVVQPQPAQNTQFMNVVSPASTPATDSWGGLAGTSTNNLPVKWGAVLTNAIADAFCESPDGNGNDYNCKTQTDTDMKAKMYDDYSYAYAYSYSYSNDYDQDYQQSDSAAYVDQVKAVAPDGNTGINAFARTGTYVNADQVGGFSQARMTAVAGKTPGPAAVNPFGPNFSG